MESYQSIMAKISTLRQKASTLRNTEKKGVISELRKLIAFYEIEPAELFSGASSKFETGKSAKSVLPALYRDPVSGKTWSGRGKHPRWLIGDKAKYLIEASAKATSPKPAKSARKGKATAVKSAAKPVVRGKPAKQTKRVKDNGSTRAAGEKQATLPAATDVSATNKS